MLTVEQVLRDTMERFEDGDDSRANLQDVLRVIRRQAPKLLTEELEEAVTTREARKRKGDTCE